jgi:hypothetical protein
MIEASKRFEINSALVRPVQRHAMLVVEERREWDWPIVEDVGVLRRLARLLGEMFLVIATFVKFATKLMAVRNRFCMSIYELIADSDKGEILGVSIQRLCIWRQRGVGDDAMT